MYVLTVRGIFLDISEAFFSSNEFGTVGALQHWVARRLPFRIGIGNWHSFMYPGTLEPRIRNGSLMSVVVRRSSAGSQGSYLLGRYCDIVAQTMQIFSRRCSEHNTYTTHA